MTSTDAYGTCHSPAGMRKKDFEGTNHTDTHHAILLSLPIAARLSQEQKVNGWGGDSDPDLGG